MSMHSLHCSMAIRIPTNMNFHEMDSATSLLIGQTIMLFYFIIVLPPLITIILHGQTCNAVALTNCNTNNNYTPGSTFERNLNRVLDRLGQAANQSGFNISDSGGVYGLFQCRADLTVDQCDACWQWATTSIRQGCGNSISASTWPFHCFLRYENYNFIGKLDTGFGSNNQDDFGHDGTEVFIPGDFQESAKNLLNNLSAKAATEAKRSAYGTSLDSLSQTIYGLVQCTRDLTTDDCNECLSSSINSIFASRLTAGDKYWSRSCIFRYQIYPFYNSSLQLPPVPPGGAANYSPQNKSSDKRTYLILGVVGALVLGIIIGVFATARRLKSAIAPRGYQDHREENTLLVNDRPIVFTMETLVAATRNFHDDNKLGEGGFGPVYKGTTQHGKEIAVKKLSLKSTQGRKEFLNEIKLVAKIQHKNLVNLLGCCAQESERLLVYEYLPNKSLDKVLFDPNKRKRLDWRKRYNIIMGVARGLVYLHEDSPLRIIHRDIKASNILLDEQLNPKIADFGLARLFSEDETHVNTRVAGTYGYMPPEYAMQGQLSVKADVYSFGVLLLEVITGRKNTDYNLSPEMQILLGWAWRSYQGGNIVQLIDPAIIETCDETQASRCIHVGLLCTQPESHLRPLMSTVNLMLSTDSVKLLPDPTKPAFVNSYVSQTNQINSSGWSHASATASSSVLPAHIPATPASNATVSISELIPR
eukprot:PITA_36649